MAHGLVEQLGQAGFSAVAPGSLADNAVAERLGVGMSARWSQRHAAFVAGLGTFSISGGLITARGIAHRLASVVTDAAIAPTERPYQDDPFAWCLRTARGTCGRCIDRCPAGSIGQANADRDKTACWNNMNAIAPGLRNDFGWDQHRYGCGLCQTDVPCENTNPTADD